MTTFFQDLRYALRLLRKNPGFTLVAILTLALGIGANTAIFSVINALFLHPPGIPHPERLVALRAKYDKLGLNNIVISAPDFAQIRDKTEVFDSAAIVKQADFNYLAEEGPQRLLGAEVSWQWFDVFSAKPLLGRTFVPEDDQPNANHQVVLAYGAWKHLFGGDPGVVGRTVQFNQQPHKIIGVMPAEFHWPNETDLWVPLGLAPAEFSPDNRYNENYFSVARIRTGVTFPRAQTFVGLLTEQDIQHDPSGKFAQNSGWGMFIVPLGTLFLAKSGRRFVFCSERLLSCSSSRAPTSRVCFSRRPRDALKNLPSARRWERGVGN